MNILNNRKWLSEPRIVAGIMTGTSVDAVDTVIAKFSAAEEKHGVELISHTKTMFPAELQKSIKDIFSSKIEISEAAKVEFALAYVYAEALEKAAADAKVNLSDIDVCGIHGQTVYHQPKAENYAGISMAATLQLGSGRALSSLSGIPVVSDFRSADIALGGEGAPLIPVFDANFLSEPGKNVTTLNIGGMANITILPKDSGSKIMAFDTGPGNILMDIYMTKFYEQAFDDQGEVAGLGKEIPGFLEELMQIDFITKEPPKSTGRELFNEKLIDDFLHNVKSSGEAKANVIHTLTKFTAWSIAENIRRFGDKNSKIIVSGGGAKNHTLLKMLAAELPDAEIKLSAEEGIPVDAKEALCFGYLAWRTLGGLPSNIPSVTGASRESILGDISLP